MSETGTEPGIYTFFHYITLWPFVRINSLIFNGTIIKIGSPLSTPFTIVHFTNNNEAVKVVIYLQATTWFIVYKGAFMYISLLCHENAEAVSLIILIHLTLVLPNLVVEFEPYCSLFQIT